MVRRKKGLARNNEFGLVTYLNPRSIASEAYRSLRTNIHYSNIDNKIKTISITSPSPCEGKTTICSNIGVSIAQSGKKVLIIDGDLRKPKIKKYFGLHTGVGITDVIVEDIPIREVIKPIVDVRNLYVVTSGAIPPNPAEILGSNKFKEVINDISRSFDTVIIDTPPVGQLADGAIIGGIVDGVILVIACGQSNVEMARYAKTALQNVDANILGVVLNKIDNAYYSRYYNRYYDKYYYEENV